jgi:hypothetical protein
MSRIFLLVLGAAMLIGCQQPRYAWVYDRQADFTRLKNYAWLAGEEHGTAGREIGGMSIDQMIKGMVDKELAAKGYTRVAGAQPDFTVRCRSVLEFRAGETGGGAPVNEPVLMGGERYEVVSPAPDLSPEQPSSYKVGTIYITMNDPKSSTVLWRGVAEAVIREQATDEQRRDRLGEAMHKLLEKFPPNTGK